MWCERLVAVLISLLAGGCAGQWAVVKGYRVVMKADIVRDFPGMCYDVSSCSARAVNESWAIGVCSRAACEVDESGILLEVHYTCPRLQNRPTLMCDIIEDKRLPFPACCPRMICQRHKKQPPPTQTKLKPFTPHATVDKELRKIPFVLKRFLEVQNTTLLDAIILNRIKALEAAANASVVYMGQGFNVSFNNSSDIEGFSEAALTTEGPGTTTQDTTPFATTEDSVTTPSPTPSSTAQTRQATTTTTQAPVVILNGTGLQSESLEFQPRPNVSVDDDELSFLNDAPVVPADTTPSSRPETTRTATVEKTTSETATITPDVVPVTTSVVQVTTELTESEPASPTEHTNTAEVHDTTRTVALTVPESIFHTTILPSTEPSPTTTTATVQDELKTKSTPGKKDSNLPTILRSLVDNVFDYYDYIDYYVPGQKRNASSTQEKETGDTERRKIPESMMELVKKQLTKQTTKDENVGTDSYEDLPQGDQPPSDEPEATTADPDDKELQKELVTKVEVDLHRMPKLGSQEDSTRAPATTTTTTNTAAQETTTKAASVTTLTTKASEVPVSTTTPAQPVRTDATTEASINLVKSVGAEQPRRGVNLLVENLAAPGSEQRTTTGATTVSFTTTQAPTTTTTTTTPAPQTPPSTTQKATTAAPTTPEATEHPTTQTTTTTTQAPTTRPATTLATRTVPFEVVTTSAPRSTQPDVTTETPVSTTAVPSTTTSPVTSVPTTAEPTSRRAETDAVVTEVRRTETNAPTSSATATTPAPTTGDLLITKTAPPLSSESLLADRRNATAIPLLTTTEATTVGVTTASTTRAPSTARLTTTQQAKQSPATGSDLVKAERSQKAVNGTTKSPNAPSQNNDVEYIDYVYYYDYVDVPDNSTTNGTSLSRNSTGVQPTPLKQNVTQ